MLKLYLGEDVCLINSRLSTMAGEKTFSKRRFWYWSGWLAEKAIYVKVGQDKDKTKQAMLTFAKLFVTEEEYQKVERFSQEHPIAFRNRFAVCAVRFDSLFEKFLDWLGQEQEIKMDFEEYLTFGPMPFSGVEFG